MPLADRFEFFDPRQPFTVTYGELPHWEQEGATYFITFRTADSLPASVLQNWNRERDDWLRRRGIDASSDNWRIRLRGLPHDVQREFHRVFATKMEMALDECHGDCVLRETDIATIVADSLLYFDGEHVAELLRNSESVSRSDSGTSEVRYHISDFVIMPNHVHVMVSFQRGVRLLDQCKSWKHFTAVKINRKLGTRGEFWQSESFDHLVRDADHFDRFRKYIAENRKKAGLKPGEGIYYQCPE